jgi:hypothetical protein
MLGDAYDRAAAIIGPQVESIEIAEEVERLRSAWRPVSVRVVLLAESHVYTSVSEKNSRVHQPDGVETGFARFVYCLGYGEPSLVAPKVSPNPGTWQYWKIFHDAVHDPAASHVRMWPQNATERVRAKLQVLNEMKRAGLWLVDASVTALYPRIVNDIKYKKVLRACWELYIGDIILKCSASAVLVIGKGVYGAIGDLVNRVAQQAEIVVINQPNARMKPDEIHNQRCRIFDLCRRHAAWGA